jgi:hypothetical protein
MCVASPWQGKPALFPGESGIPLLPKQIGYTLYGPWFCPGSYSRGHESHSTLSSTVIGYL